MSEEQIYTIPLRTAKRVPRWKRSKRAVTEVRLFLSRHTKAEDIKIDPAISERIWERGAEKPPSRIRVKVTKDDDGVVEAKLAEGKEFSS
ncbi:MAG: 50S ribosomal protein L31e [Halobacteriota archaeon]|nr:50S ribosomal protein L31e [Halobacteriota archaeon]